MPKWWKRKEAKWWEIEAEKQGMTEKAYLDLLRMEKENAEMSLAVLKKREDARSRREKWDDYQAEQFEILKGKIAGYEEVAQVHSAYISILLKKLGATEDNMVTITPSEVTEALKKYEARAVNTGEGWGLYCEGKE